MGRIENTIKIIGLIILTYIILEGLRFHNSEVLYEQRKTIDGTVIYDIETVPPILTELRAIKYLEEMDKQKQASLRNW